MAEWEMYMEAVLTKKGVFGLVEGSVTRPAGSPNHKSVLSFLNKQREARSEIILRLSPSQLPHARDPDPKVIWEELHRVHQARGFATKHALRRKFLYASKEATQSMQSWIAQVRQAAHRLTAAGGTASEEDIIIVLTQGLPITFESLIISLDAAHPNELTVDYVIGRLINEEVRQEMASVQIKFEPVQAFAANATARSLTQITCFKCGKKGHFKSECPDIEPATAAAAWLNKDPTNYAF